MRISLLFALFVAVPLLAFEQRYGGPGPASAARFDQQAPPPVSPPAAAPKQGQERGQSSDVRLGWQWWKDAEVRKQLQLTDRQVQQISQLYDDRVRQIRPTWEALQKHQAELNKMGRERTVDVATYSLHVTNAEGLRSEVNKTRYVLVYAISRRLSAEQHQKLQEIYEKRFGRSGGSSPRPGR
jgi:Spy/CpxP family protein refolding chaperone